MVSDARRRLHAPDLAHPRKRAQLFLKEEDIVRLWNGPARVYLFTDGSKLGELNAVLPGPANRFGESGGKLILTNQQSN